MNCSACPRRRPGNRIHRHQRGLGIGECAPGNPGTSSSWKLLSPRLGFTFRPDEEGRSAIKGFFGIHYDQNVIGNWDAPAPGVTPWQLYALNDDGTLGDLLFATTSADLAQPDNLVAPRSYHYTAAYEREVGNNMSFGLQYVHKYTDRMVGWSILGGQYESVQWADPYTGAPMTLLSQTVQPTLVKGNSPPETSPALLRSTNRPTTASCSTSPCGTPASGTSRVPTPTRSHMVSSRVRGSSPRTIPSTEARLGQDPNAYLNLNDGQRLQGDRPHMFRLQGVLFLALGSLMLAANVNIESGKPFSRQVRASRE